MSWATIVTGLHERFATVAGLDAKAILDYEPASLDNLPLLYTLLDGFERGQAGQLTTMRYRGLHRLCIRWQDNERAEQELMAFVNAVPAAVDADPHLGGRITHGWAEIADARAVFVTIDSNLYRAIDFFSNVLEKGARGSGL